MIKGGCFAPKMLSRSAFLNQMATVPDDHQSEQAVDEVEFGMNQSVGDNAINVNMILDPYLVDLTPI